MKITDIKPTISKLIPGPFSAIPTAKFLRDNNIKYEKQPGFFGGCFCVVLVKDPRFTEETLFVASASLL